MSYEKIDGGYKNTLNNRNGDTFFIYVDEKGKQTKMVQANGRTQIYVCDSDSNLVEETLMSGATAKYTYDTNGNGNSLTDVPVL